MCAIEASENGFWCDKPYLLLSESYLYEKEKVILYQHLVIEAEQIKIYRFWNHFFSNGDLSEILDKYGFEGYTFHGNIIPDGDGYESRDITFCTATCPAKTSG